MELNIHVSGLGGHGEPGSLLLLPRELAPGLARAREVRRVCPPPLVRQLWGQCQDPRGGGSVM